MRGGWRKLELVERRKFLRALVVVPFAPQLLKGLSWAAPTPAEAAARGSGGFSAAVPAGTILPFVGKGAPPGFLPCDGRPVPRFAYKALYGAVGASYGAGRGWFRTPDLRARMSRPEPKVAMTPMTFGQVLRDPASYHERPIDPAPAIRWVIRT